MKFFIRVLDSGKILVKDLQTQEASILKDMEEVSSSIQAAIDGEVGPEKEPTELEKYTEWYNSNQQEMFSGQEETIDGNSGDDSGHLSGAESDNGNGPRES